MKQKVTVDSGTYEAASLDDFCIGDVGIVVKSPYKCHADEDGKKKGEDTYAGEAFVYGVDQIVMFSGTYSKIDDRLKTEWVVRHLRPGESITISGVGYED